MTPAFVALLDAYERAPAKAKPQAQAALFDAVRRAAAEDAPTRTFPTGKALELWAKVKPATRRYFLKQGLIATGDAGVRRLIEHPELGEVFLALQDELFFEHARKQATP